MGTPEEQKVVRPLRNGVIIHETIDHSLVQALVSAGRVKPEDAFYHPQRNVVITSISLSPDHAADQPKIETIDVKSGDIVLVLSDGTLDTLRSQEIAALSIGATSAAEPAFKIRIAQSASLAKFLAESPDGKWRDDNTTILVAIIR